MPKELSEAEVAAFRSQLCCQAVDLFVERGYAGFTMREIAKRVGCSAMTPYRYFENKAEIFEAVRSECFARFGEALQRLMESMPADIRPLERIRTMGRFFVAFAVDEPRAYRVMFEIDGGDWPDDWQLPETERETWYPLVDAVRAAVDAGDLAGDPEVLAHLLWATMHGVVSLQHAGRLRLGKSLDDLIEPGLDLILGEAS